MSENLALCYTESYPVNHATQSASGEWEEKANGNWDTKNEGSFAVTKIVLVTEHIFVQLSVHLVFSSK